MPVPMSRKGVPLAFRRSLSRAMLGLALASVGSLGLDAPALAQGFPVPGKQITIVVPYGAGTSSDLLARRVGTSLSQLLGNPVLVLNKPGAGAILGTETVVRAEPDGHTLLFGASQTAINPSVYKKLPYDTVTDLIPVARVSSQPMILVVGPSLGVKSLRELIDHGRRNPGQLTNAGLGVGNSVHLSGSYLASLGQFDLRYISYNAFGPMLVDVMRGEVSMMFYPYAAIAEHIATGKLTALATTGEARGAFLPNVPTMVELGYKDFVLPTWQGFFAPARTPDPVVQAVFAAVRRAVDTPEMTRQLMDTGTLVKLESPQEFSRFVRSQIETFRTLAGIAKVEPQ